MTWRNVGIWCLHHLQLNFFLLSLKKWGKRHGQPRGKKHKKKMRRKEYLFCGVYSSLKINFALGSGRQTLLSSTSIFSNGALQFLVLLPDKATKPGDILLHSEEWGAFRCMKKK